MTADKTVKLPVPLIIINYNYALITPQLDFIITPQLDFAPHPNPHGKYDNGVPYK